MPRRRTSPVYIGHVHASDLPHELRPEAGVRVLLHKVAAEPGDEVGEMPVLPDEQEDRRRELRHHTLRQPERLRDEPQRQSGLSGVLRRLRELQHLAGQAEEEVHEASVRDALPPEPRGVRRQREVHALQDEQARVLPLESAAAAAAAVGGGRFGGRRLPAAVAAAAAALPLGGLLAQARGLVCRAGGRACP